MNTNKDYYKILGVDKTASDDEIKKAYRNLAKQWHPDRCTDASKKAEYENKFKDINEAYQVLSDKNTRYQFDNGGFDASSFNFHGFGNFEDIFKDMGGFGFDPFNVFNMHINRNAGTKISVGQNVGVRIKLTYEEIFNGVHKHIRYHRNVVCDECNGKGYSSDGHLENCKHCNGSGKRVTINGNWQQITPCPYCEGKGKVIINPCHKCNGVGFVDEINEIEVDIPKGVFNGMRFTMAEMGSASKDINGKNGELIIEIEEEDSNEYIRENNDIYKLIDIPIVDAILGCKIKVTSIDNKILETEIHSGTEDGSKIRFKGKGMPIYGSDKYGDMICEIRLAIPKNLNSNEIRLLNELKKEEHFK